MDFKSITDNYNAIDSKRQKLNDKINDFHKKIYRLENRVKKMHDEWWWGESLVRPVMDEVAKATPNLTWDYESLVSMGLRCAISVFAHLNGKCVAHLCFTPRSAENGYLGFDCGKKEGMEDAHHMSLASLNGFDNKTIAVESIEQLVEYVEISVKNAIKFGEVE